MYMQGMYHTAVWLICWMVCGKEELKLGRRVTSILNFLSGCPTSCRLTTVWAGLRLSLYSLFCDWVRLSYRLTALWKPSFFIKGHWWVMSEEQRTEQRNRTEYTHNIDYRTRYTCQDQVYYRIQNTYSDYIINDFQPLQYSINQWSNDTVFLITKESVFRLAIDAALIVLKVDQIIALHEWCIFNVRFWYLFIQYGVYGCTYGMSGREWDTLGISVM